MPRRNRRASYLRQIHVLETCRPLLAPPTSTRRADLSNLRVLHPRAQLAELGLLEKSQVLWAKAWSPATVFHLHARGAFETGFLVSGQ